MKSLSRICRTMISTILNLPILCFYLGFLNTWHVTKIESGAKCKPFRRVIHSHVMDDGEKCHFCCMELPKQYVMIANDSTINKPYRLLFATIRPLFLSFVWAVVFNLLNYLFDVSSVSFLLLFQSALGCVLAFDAMVLMWLLYPSYTNKIKD